eukprot:2521589-Rhodomonas_salina.1
MASMGGTRKASADWATPPTRLPAPPDANQRLAASVWTLDAAPDQHSRFHGARTKECVDFEEGAGKGMGGWPQILPTSLSWAMPKAVKSRPARMRLRVAASLRSKPWSSPTSTGRGPSTRFSTISREEASMTCERHRSSPRQLTVDSGRCVPSQAFRFGLVHGTGSAPPRHRWSHRRGRMRYARFSFTSRSEHAARIL